MNGTILEGSSVVAPDKPNRSGGTTMTPPEVEYRIIELTQGKVAYVSPHRYDELVQFRWCAWWCKDSQNYYAARGLKRVNGRYRSILMHRQILGLEYGDKRIGDHKARSRTLDNTDSNLRIAPTRAEQEHNKGKRRHNTSGYKGVGFDKRRGKWYAKIGVNKGYKWLGYYATALEAYNAYCRAAKQFHGEFMCVE